MKKMLSVLLSVLLCFGAFLPVLAAETDGEEVARLILIAKEKLAIDDEKVEFRSYNLNNYNGEKKYNLYWQSKEEEEYCDINVTIDENGIITSYHYYKNKKNDRLTFSTYSKAEALAAAKSFIEKIDPDKLPFLSEGEAERDYNGNYYVTYNRLENGIPVRNNLLTLQVDSNTLEVTGYNSSWRKMSFAQGTPITEAEAQKVFADQMGYKLFYQIVSEDYENTAHLIYRSRYDNNVMVDALTGKTVDYDELEELAKNEAVFGLAAPDAAASGGATLSEKELALVAQVTAMISKEEADALARKVPEFDITEEYLLQNYDIYRRHTGEYIISLRYRKENDEEKGSGSRNVSLLADSGLIISFSGYTYVPYDETKPEPEKIKNEVLQEKGKAFLKQYYGDFFSQMTEKEYFDSEDQGFEYLRLVNGVPVYNNGASFRYDNETGALTSFNLNWTDMEFPSVEGVKSVEEANEAVMKDGNFSLRYVPVYLDHKEDKQNRIIIGRPVYSLEEQPLLSATTLEELSYSLKPQQEKKVPVYTDIMGHYSAQRIEKLLAHDVYLPADDQGRLRPEEGVTQYDFFLLLDTVIWKTGYESDMEDMYRRLVNQGILTKEEIAPTAIVSRIDGITYLLRALGYGEFMKIPGIFRCPFGDVPAECEGPAAIASGLKLVSGDGGNFYPHNELRRADAMIIIYNYMAR